jgi:glycosyltransferase involved in cell wall biosynthesis
MDNVRALQPPEAGGNRKLKVLVVSHMDPRLAHGGAEIAAFQLFQKLKARSDTDALFLAASPGLIAPRDGVALIQPHAPDNFLYTMRQFDHFNFSNLDEGLTVELIELLEEFRPDAVHLHHYTNFGLETLFTIRRVLPQARIIVTLHEFLAICHHFGQMVKRPSLALCDKSGALDCARCYPENSPQDFFLREMFIKRFFRLVDHFVSPSRFLAERYIAWGIARERISVIENGVPDLMERGTRAYPDMRGQVTFATFGQISKLKGFELVCDAAAELVGEKSIRIEIHGDYSTQPPQFQEEVRERLERLPANVAFIGPYANSDVDRLMQSVHAILVPSLWWENSPVVIQEAFANRRPVICSDIGGMAEKVRDGIDGFHFRARSAHALAALLRRLAAEPQLLRAAQAAITPPPSIEETSAQLVRLYRGAGAFIPAGDARSAFTPVQAV